MSQDTPLSLGPRLGANTRVHWPSTVCGIKPRADLNVELSTNISSSVLSLASTSIMQWSLDTGSCGWECDSSLSITVVNQVAGRGQVAKCTTDLALQRSVPIFKRVGRLQTLDLATSESDDQGKKTEPPFASRLFAFHHHRTSSASTIWTSPGGSALGLSSHPLSRVQKWTCTSLPDEDGITKVREPGDNNTCRHPAVPAQASGSKQQHHHLSAISGSSTYNTFSNLAPEEVASIKGARRFHATTHHHRPYLTKLHLIQANDIGAPPGPEEHCGRLASVLASSICAIWQAVACAEGTRSKAPFSPCRISWI
ncbi:hypothetical protein QBC39DRAFT_436324 [Podospora conica]|nr:hypothetical protein QBC39DRAFT_436324 [Schizothecium conicum]